MFFRLERVVAAWGELDELDVAELSAWNDQDAGTDIDGERSKT